MARRKVKATLNEFARAVLIVHEAMERAQEVCGYATRSNLYEASETLYGVNVLVVQAKRVPQP